jgi:hypothetical protein
MSADLTCYACTTPERCRAARECHIASVIGNGGKPEPAVKPSCDSCRFVKHYGNGSCAHACRRYPPQLVDGHSRFPDAKGWCGEFQEKAT